MENTKIVNTLSEFKINKEYGKSLKDKILEAKSEVDVRALIEFSKTYKEANVKTVKKWVVAANKRIEELKNRALVKEEVMVKAPVVKAKSRAKPKMVETK